MRILLIGLMCALLCCAPEVMGAVSASCRLFVVSVMPGLLPYMVLSLMLASRFSGRLPPWGMLLLGWGGGSPAGARLLALDGEKPRAQRIRLAVSTATMSPMFLYGTAGGWLGSPMAGVALLFSVLLGGWLAGLAAQAFERPAAGEAPATADSHPGAPLSFGEAVEQTARTLLLVCGTMAMLRIPAAIAEVMFAGAALPLVTLLEVTAGAERIAVLPVPLPLRTALMAGATGFGGMAIIMQNRALYPKGFLFLPCQVMWQALHGAFSFLLALGAMQLLPD